MLDQAQQDAATTASAHREALAAAREDTAALSGIRSTLEQAGAPRQKRTGTLPANNDGHGAE